MAKKPKKLRKGPKGVVGGSKSSGPKNAGEAYMPKVGPEEEQAEFTLQAIVLGMVLSVVFGAANAYLGLKVGLTVSASIPAAVIGMGVLRGVFKRGSLLEMNMVQTVGSAGESLAAGVIFTVPAMIMLARELAQENPAMAVTTPGVGRIFVIAAVGGILGILFMIPLRRFLIVQEHGNLPFPEGTACSEVLTAGQEGGNAAKVVFWGLFFGALYKLLQHCGISTGFLMGEAGFSVPGMMKAHVGMELGASLLGVGFILGPGIAGYMLSGAILGWLVLIPLIAFLGQHVAAPVFPATETIAKLGPGGIWSFYVRYIGAGAVAFGGVLSLIKALPMIYQTVSSGIFTSAKNAEDMPRTQQDLDLRVVLGMILAMACLIWWLPVFDLSFVGSLCVVTFAFFFTTVSARIVGIVGSSSNPASGMTIATLLMTSVIFLQAGYTGTAGMFAAMTVGSIVCIGICIGGDTSQDLKTGFLVGATPWRQQIGEMIGVLVSAACVGATLYLLDAAYPLGGKDLAAPQASLMKLVVKGVMQGDLPWDFVSVGAFIGGAVECLGIGCLPFAVGLYLPFSLSSPIMLGGLIRWAFDAFLKGPEAAEKGERGILLASGLIAGEATMGVGIAAAVSVFETPFFKGGGLHKWFQGMAASGADREPSMALSLLLFLGLAFLFLNLYMGSYKPGGKGKS